MPIQIAIVPQGFEDAAKQLRKIDGAFPEAAAEAINRGLISGRTVAVKSIRGRYAIKASDLKEAGMKIKRASWQRVEGSLNAKGTMLPVSLFSAKSKVRRVGGKRKVFVFAKIIKGPQKLVKGAFMTRPGKVMERRQNARYPIFPVSTIGVPYMVRQRKISGTVQETITEATAKRLTHNVNRMLARAAARVSKRKR